jgi:hypothetical protein
MNEPAINPYQSPTSDGGSLLNLDDAGSARPLYLLYSVGSATLAVFLGGPLAGGIIMAINYKRLGRPVAAIHAVVWTAVATAIIMATAMMIPDEYNVPSVVFLAPQIFCMYGLAKSLQGPAIEAHRSDLGLMASAWGAAGIGLLTGVVVLVAVFAIIIAKVCIFDA